MAEILYGRVLGVVKILCSFSVKVKSDKSVSSINHEISFCLFFATAFRFMNQKKRLKAENKREEEQKLRGLKSHAKFIIPRHFAHNAFTFQSNIYAAR